MKIHDVTRPLFHKDIVYPGDLAPSFCQDERNLYLISDLHFSSHAGTHIDAPVHYLKTGMTVDEIPLGTLIGTCRVVDVQDAGSRITAKRLEPAVAGTERLLLRTAFSGCDRFDPDYPHITPDAAGLLTRHRIKCIGIDSPSIESYECDGSVHRELLSHGCIIIELLDLAHVSEGDYLMAALPLRLAGVDGSPSRVVLIEEER
jgi:arylformamidase